MGISGMNITAVGPADLRSAGESSVLRVEWKILRGLLCALGASGEESTREEIDRKAMEIEADLQLVQAIHDRYQEVIERYQETISRRMWKFSRVASDHEELVQEVFVEAYLSLHSYRGEAGLEHWLQRIATRVGYRFWTRQTKQRRNETITGNESIRREAFQERNGSRLEAEEAAEQVYRLLARLPAEDRLVMTLLHLEEYSVAEIAEQMRWSESLVKVRAHRARKKLAEWLGEENDD